MCPRLIKWLLRRRDRPGQGLVEFAIAVPVFLLFVFGIMQAVLIYKAYLAVNQAATDATHVLAAQSSDPPADGNTVHADALGLNALGRALATQDLNSIVSVDVARVDQVGNPFTIQVTASDLLVGGSLPSPGQTFTEDNNYKITKPFGGQSCPVGQFYLTNALAPTSGSVYWKPCAPPWDGTKYDSLANQNGRHDIRCTEDTIKVTVKYRYASISFPVHYDIVLTGQDSTSLEPRAFLGNAGTQNQLGGCN